MPAPKWRRAIFLFWTLLLVTLCGIPAHTKHQAGMLIRGSVGRDDRREENREMRGWHVGSGFAGKRTDVEEAAVIEELKPAHRVETLRCVANTAGTSARPHPRAAPISRAKMRELRGHVCAPTSSSRARRGEGKTEEQEEAGGRRPVEAGTSPASCLAPCGAGETDAGARV